MKFRGMANGLYVSPPKRASLCMWMRNLRSKRWTQSADAADASRPGPRSHNHKWPGITSLLAPLDIEGGRVIGKCYERHHAVEFREFFGDRRHAEKHLSDPLDRYPGPRSERKREQRLAQVVPSAPKASGGLLLALSNCLRALLDTAFPMK